MKTQLLCFILYTMTIYLTCGTFNLAVAASPPPGGSGTHFHGVIDDQWNKQYSDQFANRHARTAAANLEPEKTVRAIYFRPNDREPLPDIDVDLARILTQTQQSYAEVMEQQGFGSKTFQIETDDTGNVVVHHINGQFGDTYYHTDLFNKVYEEVGSQFDLSKNIYLVAFDISNESVLCGLGRLGQAIIHASSGCFGVSFAAHELGHAFGLSHDRRRDANRTPTTYHADLIATTYCAAEWLDVHPYFNRGDTISNKNTEIQEIDAHLTSSGEAMRFRYRITDPDGLHQVQLVFADGELATCKRLNGRSELYEFTFSPTLYGLSKRLELRVIDLHGNIRIQSYPIDTSHLRPRLNKPVSIPDANLAKAIRSSLKLKPSEPLTRLNLIDLTQLTAHNSQINDLTGLEHSKQLLFLYVSRNQITDIRPIANLTRLHTIDCSWNQLTDIRALANLNSVQNLYLRSNQITDISAVTNMTSLRTLNLSENQIRDITPIENVKNLYQLELADNQLTDISPIANSRHLEKLHLSHNSITDISAVAGLTNLIYLTLVNNSISDISAVAGLTDLIELHLWTNAISDISPVAGLTNLKVLHLIHNSISDISVVAGLTNLTELHLVGNNISDISPLVANTGLGSGDRVLLKLNSLSYQSLHTHIPILRRRGVTVEFDNRAHPALLKISGDDQTGTAFLALAQPFIVEAQDANGSAIAGISVTFTITMGSGTLTVTNTRTDENGRAQSTLILGPIIEPYTVEVFAVGIDNPVTFSAIADSELSPMRADVNSDGFVNVLDLILIASNLGQSGQNSADVNGDRVVDILDLVLAAGMFEEAAAAPSAQPQAPETLTAVEVRDWLTDARSLKPKEPIMKKGIIVLEQLLVSLIPKKTELLANYPNPFNPETWIPYRLAEDAFVTLTIYDLNGQIVCTLDVGHQIAAVYENRSKAVHWDGRNELGEQVTSGVYFYHLSAGDYSATRKMLIIK